MEDEERMLNIVVPSVVGGHAGPLVRAAIIFTCETCQYLEGEPDGNGRQDLFYWQCRRLNKGLETTSDREKAPCTPAWCPFKDYARREALATSLKLRSEIETLLQPAIRLLKIEKGLHPNQRNVQFRVSHQVGTEKPQQAYASVLAWTQQIVDDKYLAVAVVQEHQNRQHVLVEFQEEVLPGMSRRQWVDRSQMINLPAS